MPPFSEVLQDLLGDRFTLVRELGGGGMSRVFLATEGALRREVVVKVLPPELVSAESLQRFEREIETTVALQHPLILPVLTAGGRDDIVYYVTPYLSGQSLRRRMAEGARFTLVEATALAQDLLAAVAFAHGRGIVHRDIKPANVLVADGRAVLADFGIARALEAADDGTTPSLTRDETSPYAAPEGSSRPASDVFALAAVLHEMLVGSAPARGVGAERLAAKLRAAHPAESRARVVALARLIASGLALRPADRPESAEAFSRALTAVAVDRAGGRRVRQAMLAAAAVGGVVIALSFTRPRATLPSESTTRDRPVPVASVLPIDPTPAVGRADSAAAPAEVARVPREAGDSAVWLVTHGAAPEALVLVRQADSASTGDARGALMHAILATVLASSYVPSEEGSVAIARALEHRTALAPGEARLAAAWQLLTAGDFPAANEAFRRLRADPSVRAWALVGEAEAIARDVLVVPAAGSPSGFAFRSNWNDGARAIRDALRATPRIDRRVVLARLFQVRPPQDGRLRSGRGSDGANYVGRLEADADTIRSTPYQAGPRMFLPPPGEAGRRAAELMRSEAAPLVAQWRREAPGDPGAWAISAELLEASGNVRVAGADGLTALQANARALSLARDDEERALRTRNQARLLLRAGDYAGVAALARRALRGADTLPVMQQDMLLLLSAATGRAALAASMLEHVSDLRTRQLSGPDGVPVRLQPELQRARSSFLVYASLGVCNEAVREAPARLRALADAQFDKASRPAWFDFALFQAPLELAQDCTGPGPLAQMSGQVRPITRAAAQLLAGDTASVRGQFAGMDNARARQNAPPAGPDIALGEALMRAAIGDTLGALAPLAASLKAIPVLTDLQFSRETPVASIGRALVVAAELAVGRDPAQSRQWLAQAEALWADADAPVRAQLARVRARLGAR
ncbi:MAG: serine/threonine-protein kinase [Gemmatimonadaceae bacterium]